MAANRFPEIDTSALWKQVKRACLSTLAPTLIKLVCKVRKDQWLIKLGNAKRLKN